MTSMQRHGSDRDVRRAILADTLLAYDELRSLDEEGAWPTLSLVAVKHACVRVHNASSAWQRTRELYNEAGERGSGWVRHRSVAFRLRAGDEAEKAALSGALEAGPPIAGEWALPGDRAAPDIMVSIHLRPDANAPGRLAEWRYQERALPKNQPLCEGEIAALCQEVAILAKAASSIGEQQAVLLYRVYWGTADEDEDPLCGLRRLFARFVGFATRDGLSERTAAMGWTCRNESQ
jgi:hypothetical protein